MLNDFLMSCFKKDVNMRPGATDLSKHTWVVSADKPSPAASSVKQVATPPKEYNQVIGEIEHYNEALEKQFHQEPSADELQEQRDIINKSLTLTQANKLKMKKMKEEREKKASQTPKSVASNAGSKKATSNKSPSPSSQQKKQSLKLQVNSIDVGSLSQPKPASIGKVQPKKVEEDTEDWDAEFGIESDAQPLKLQLPGQSKAPEPKSDLAASLMESLGSFDVDDTPRTETLGFGGLSLDGISLEGLGPKPKTQGGKISTFTKKQLGGALQDLDNFMSDDDQDWSQLANKAPKPTPGSRPGTVGRTGSKNLNKFAEADSDGFDDG